MGLCFLPIRLDKALWPSARRPLRETGNQETCGIGRSRSASRFRGSSSFSLIFFSTPTMPAGRMVVYVSMTCRDTVPPPPAPGALGSSPARRTQDIGRATDLSRRLAVGQRRRHVTSCLRGERMACTPETGNLAKRGAKVRLLWHALTRSTRAHCTASTTSPAKGSWVLHFCSPCTPPLSTQGSPNQWEL